VWLGRWLWFEERWLAHLTGNNTSTNHKTVQKQKQTHPRFSQFEHFLVHTPKCGGSFAFDMLAELVQSSPEYRALAVEDRFMVCDGRTRPTAHFEKYYPLTAAPSSSSSFWGSWSRSASPPPCTLWMAEQPYTTRARHNYIVLRDPRSHILAQYFHCKESINHYDRRKYMPSLTEWLQAWVTAMGNETLADLYTDQFRCFDPRNMQTRFAAGLNESSRSRMGGLLLSSSSSSLLSSIAAATTTTTAIEEVTHALESQFVVVGDNHRMWESICAIFIRYTSWVPPDCDCSWLKGNQDDDTEEDGDQQSQPSQEHEHGRRLKIHFYGHGVRHHGNTFRTTPEQDELLAQLMTTDQPLYEIGKQVFETQVKAFEADYGIRLCPKRPPHTKKKTTKKTKTT